MVGNAQIVWGPENEGVGAGSLRLGGSLLEMGRE